MYPFNTFSADMMNHLLPGQRAMQDTLLAGTGEAVSAAGALDPEEPLTELSVDGTKAYTLADGPVGVAGMVKVVRCVAAANTPAGTLTIASPDNTAGFVCPATFFFDTRGQELTLYWTGTKWRCIAKKRVGWKVLTVGTTVTTGIADMSHISLAVTATVQSTGTKGIPAGAAVGEKLLIGCSTADSTPHGDIFMTSVIDVKGTAGNTLDDFTATTDHVLLEWTGSAWQILNNHTTAVAVTTV
jgi:hypothetical protein